MGACYLEVGKHKFRVWDNGPVYPEPIDRIPVMAREMPPEEIEEVYTKVVDYLRDM